MAVQKIFLLVGPLVILILVWVFLNPKISKGVSGITISTTKASFYIPLTEPKKVYMFNPKPVKLAEIIKEARDFPATFGIIVKNLSTGQEVHLNPNEEFTSASLYKLAVMYTIYYKASFGELDLERKDIKDNLNQMITISSNEAAIYLVEKYTSWKEITKLMHNLGLNSTNLNITPQVTTPADMAKLIELLAEGKAVSLEASISMLELMAGQQRNDRIPVLIPPGSVIAHKTGELGDVRHDAGLILTPENNYILVLMSKGSNNPESVKPVMAKISLDVYEFFKNQWANPPEIL